MVNAFRFLGLSYSLVLPRAEHGLGPCCARCHSCSCRLARCFAAVYRAGYFSRFTSTAVGSFVISLGVKRLSPCFFEGAKLYENQRWLLA